MSFTCRAWVDRHSPFKGATLYVHATIAEVANDLARFEFWMSMGNLAKRCRISRSTAIHAVTELVDGGYLRVIDDQRDHGHKPSRYRFLMPADCPVIWEVDYGEQDDLTAPRKVRGYTTPPKDEVRDHATPEVRGDTTPGARPRDTGARPRDTSTSRDKEEPEIKTQVPLRSRNPDVVKVFDAWKASTGRTDKTILDSKREARIAKALAAYPIEDVLDAVRGWENSAHHRGENKDGQVYNELDLLLRDAQHIEMFRDFARRGPVVSILRPKPTNDRGVSTSQFIERMQRRHGGGG